MTDSIENIRREALAEIPLAGSLEALDAFRVKFLARKGLIPTLFDSLKDVPPAERPQTGKALNALRVEVQSLFDERKAALEAGSRSSKERIDLTLPGRRLW